MKGHQVIVSVYRFRKVLLPVVLVALAACSSPSSPQALAPTTDAVATQAPSPQAPSVVPTLVATATPVPTATPQPSPTPEPESRAEAVRQRGRLICGVEQDQPGFAAEDEGGDRYGLDVDYCRAVAAAVLDDPAALEVRALGRRELLVALAGDAIDLIGGTMVLTRTTELEDGLAFGPPTFDAGQGLLSLVEGSLARFPLRQEPSVCVVGGSDEERLLAEYFLARNQPITAVVFERRADVLEAYAEGQCGAISGPRSALAAERLEFAEPAAHVFLDGLLNSAPRAPAVSGADAEWLAIVSSVVSATLEAEALGVSADNLATLADSDDGDVRRLLGQSGDAGRPPGLARDYAARVITAVGNYGEIYDRHFGPATALDIPRVQPYD